MEAFIKAIQDWEPLPILKGLLEKDVNRVNNWTDSNQFDCMHHVILASNSEAMRLLFLKGYFKEPHQPLCNTYLHFACYLGRRSLLNILLEERPGDFRLGRLCYPEKCQCMHRGMGELGDGCNGHWHTSQMSPLDAAANARRLCYTRNLHPDVV